MRKSVNPTLRKSFNPTIHQSDNPPIRESVNPSIRQSFNPPIRQSLNPSVPHSFNARNARTLNPRIRRPFGGGPPARRPHRRISTQAAISGHAVTGNRTWLPRRLRTQNISRRWLLGSSIRILDLGHRNVIGVSVDFTTYRGFAASPPARHGVQAAHQTDARVAGSRSTLGAVLRPQHSAHHTRRARYSAARGLAAGIASRTRS